MMKNYSNNIKKVIHYNSTYLPLTENWIYEQIKNFRRYSPIVYTLRTENLGLFPTKTVRSLELKKGLGDLTTFFNKVWNKLFNFHVGFIFLLRKDKPNLIHAHFGPSGYNFLFYKKLLKIPMITSFYGYDMSLLPCQNPKWGKFYKKLFKQGDLFLVEGNHMKKCLVGLGCPGEKIIVQHLGVDIEQIEFIPRKISNNEVIRVLIAASFREKKGIPYAVEAFGRLKKDHPELKIELTIIGDSNGENREEREKRRIFNIIEKYDLRNSVRLLGYQPHNILLMEAKRCHIFLSPSVHASDGDTEGGIPVAIIEASASGMPILSTKHCDIPEIVIDGKNGFLVPERNIDKLIEKLKILLLNPSMWESMGRYGRKHIEREYDVKKQVKKLEEIYDELLCKYSNC